jgi:2-alkenal reductase
MKTNKTHRNRLLVLWVVVLALTAMACQAVSFEGGINNPADILQDAEVIQDPIATRTPVSIAPPTQQPLSNPPSPSAIANDDAVLIDLYARVNPSVVNITNFGSLNDQVEAASQGSGFVYDALGHIVTNAHVIQGASELEVTFADGTTRLAELIGEDLNSDLAVVLVQNLPEGIQPLPLGNMEDLKVGQTVVAIGNPFGLAGTLTRGIISALGRSIPALTPFSIPQSIQTDAAINPGNSGGPLLNLKGEVVGVNAQIETGGTTRSNLGVGFAIPISIVRRIVPDLIEKGEHNWAWLGVQGGDLNPSLVEAMDLPVDKGAYIADVVDGGPAQDAGLGGATDQVNLRGRTVATGGDVVVAINGQPITSFDDLLIYIALNTDPGQDVVLRVLRDGEYQDINVSLEPRPANFENPIIQP